MRSMHDLNDPELLIGPATNNSATKNPKAKTNDSEMVRKMNNPKRTKNNTVVSNNKVAAPLN